jgi:hypothetical protein
VFTEKAARHLILIYGYARKIEKEIVVILLGKDRVVSRIYIPSQYSWIDRNVFKKRDIARLGFRFGEKVLGYCHNHLNDSLEPSDSDMRVLPQLSRIKRAENPVGLLLAGNHAVIFNRKSVIEGAYATSLKFSSPKSELSLGLKRKLQILEKQGVYRERKKILTMKNLFFGVSGYMVVKMIKRGKNNG